MFSALMTAMQRELRREAVVMMMRVATFAQSDQMISSALRCRPVMANEQVQESSGLQVGGFRRLWLRRRARHQSAGLGDACAILHRRQHAR